MDARSDDPDALASRFAAIADAADERDTKMWAMLALLEDELDLPCDARVDGKRVMLTHVDFGGDAVGGLTAELTVDERRVAVPLGEVEVLKRERGAVLVTAYRDWFRGRRARALAPAPTPPSQTTATDDGPVRLFVRSVSERVCRCRRLPDGQDVIFRSGTGQAPVPGAILVIEVTEDGAYIAGNIQDVEVDVTAAGLDAPRLTQMSPGPPPVYTLAPAGQPAEDIVDLVAEAPVMARFGDLDEARRMLHAVLADHPAYIDAHRTLGDIALSADNPSRAAIHFAVGAAIGELAALPSDDALLPWSAPGNRPYLGCLAGLSVALRRLGRADGAERALLRLREISPNDHEQATYAIVNSGAA